MNFSLRTPGAPLKDVTDTSAVFCNFQSREIHSLCLTSKEATMCLLGMEIRIIFESVFKDTRTKARWCKHFPIALVVSDFHKEQWRNH